MESNKSLKRKRLAEESAAKNRERVAHYKRLRREQKKRRRERKKNQDVSKQRIVTDTSSGEKQVKEDLAHIVQATTQPTQLGQILRQGNLNDGTSAVEQVKMDAGPQENSHVTTQSSRGKQLLSLALKGVGVAKNKPAPNAAKSSLPAASETEKTVTRRNDLKELNPVNLKLTVGSKPIGSGTFGTCFLATYRGIPVVIKQYKEAHKDKKSAEKLFKLQKEAAHEARIIEKLGDHPGIPLLFGVILQIEPISIVLQFHGQGRESLTVFKAAKEKKVMTESEWKVIFCDVVNALQHIHDCGLVHNDLKSNNVVLEIREGFHPNPIIIDFGKSVLAVKAKKPKAKAKCVRDQYTNSYIAPELIDGSCKPCVETDTFALCFMIKTVYRLCKLSVPPVVSEALKRPPKSRPSILDVKEALSKQ